METILALDIGGTSIKFGVFANDKLIEEGFIPTNADKKDFSVQVRIHPLINQIRKRYVLSGIAISTAGTVDSKEGRIIYANDNLPNYTGVELKEEIEAEYGIPCAVENDVYCAAIAEMIHQELNDFYMITIGTGVGGAFVKDGKLTKGYLDGAGRIGEIKINQQRLDDYASTTYLINQVKSINENQDIDGKFIINKVAENDQAYLDVFKQFCENIIDALEIINLVVAPKVFLLGGGVMEQKEIFKAVFDDILKERNLEQFQIQYASLGNKAGIFGAYENFKLKCKDDKTVLESLKGKLIVSCQALDNEPLHSSFIMSKMALAAQEGGAKGIRAQGVEDINAIKNVIDLPVIGIIKKEYLDSDVYITPTIKEIESLLKTECEIIALDATHRRRPNDEKLEDLLDAIHKEGKLAMADCSTYEECLDAERMGFDIVSSTLFGYTDYSENLEGPNIKEIDRVIKNISIPFIAEGKINNPQDLLEVMELGAFSAVVGGAITRPQDITRRFVEIMKNVDY